MGKTFMMATSAAVSFFLWGMMGVSIGAFLPNASDKFALTPLSAGFVFVVWSAGFACGSFLAERLLRLKGPTVLLAVLTATAAALSLLQATVRDAGSFFLVYGGLGLCGGAVFTASHTLFGELFIDRRSSALAILDVVFSLGNMVAPLLAIVILNTGHRWQLFYSILGVGFALTAAVFTLQVSRSPARTLAPEEDPQDSRRLQRRLSFATAAGLAVACGTLGAVEWTQNVWFVTFVMHKGMSPDTGRLGLSAFTAGMIICRSIVILWKGAGHSPALVWILLGIAFIGEALAIAAPTAVLSIGGNVLLGAGIGGLFPIFLGRTMDCFPAISATVSMLMIVSLTLGGQVASFSLGALTQLFGIGVAFKLTLPTIAAMIAAFEISRRRTVH